MSMPRMAVSHHSHNPMSDLREVSMFSIWLHWARLGIRYRAGSMPWSRFPMAAK